jgi:hypothetical protein
MLDTLRSSINSVLLWIIGLIANIASGFSLISTYAGDIPVVGEGLAALFVNVQSFFNDLGYNVVHFGNYLDDAIDTISEWLDIVADLASDVNEWLSQQVSEISFDLEAIKDAVLGWIWESIQGIILGIEEIQNTLIPWLAAEASVTWQRLLDLVEYVFTGRWIGDVTELVSSALNDIVSYITTEILPGILETFRNDLFQFIAPVYNLVENFFEDINLFFSDPSAYFRKKLEEGGSDLAERLWDIIERILEWVW